MAVVRRTIWHLMASSVVAIWMLDGPIHATAEQSPSDTRVRTMSATATRVLADGLRRSATIRALTARLERSDVIIFVEVSLDPSVGHGRTSLLGTSSQARFLHTQISARLPPNRQLEILGHELQHATEIAGMPGVKDQKSLREGYLRLGWQLATTHDHETAAARDAERRVKREIADWQRSATR